MKRHGWRATLATGLVSAGMTGCQTAAPFIVSSSVESAPIVSTARRDPMLPDIGIAIEETVLPAADRPVLGSQRSGEVVGDATPPPRAAASESLSPDLLSPDSRSAASRHPPEPQPLPEVLTLPAQIELRDVLLSVSEAYPQLLGAVLEGQVAAGNEIAAWSEFDLRLKAFGIAAPEGFYPTYRQGVSLEQPAWRGGYLYGGYKIGDGNFQPWFKERETNEGGEFTLGAGLPLLKDRAIDKRRSAVLQADLARRAVEPAVRGQLIEFARQASLAYWNWVAAGQALEVQQELLRLAQQRIRQIEARVAAGDLQRIVRINNEQLIAARETKVIEAERKLQEAAIKLSLFLRDESGQPIVAATVNLPPSFPAHRPFRALHQQLETDLELATVASPELAELELRMRQTRIELANAENSLLPKLDAQLIASQDVGAAASDKRDKSPFELEAGLYGEVPLQRREARGKITATRGKLEQWALKQQLVADKVRAAVRDAVSALRAAAGRIERAGTNLDLARETLQLGRLQFDAGDLTLVDLNIYEQSVTDAQLLLIAAQADFFAALANYHAAMSTDPLVIE